MLAVADKLLIKIDVAARKKLLNVTSLLVVPPQFEYMRYNLQQGVIISVGDEVTNPDIIPGRIAITHHLVESRPNKLLFNMENGDEVRYIRSGVSGTSWDMCAIMLEDGKTLIPLPEFIICQQYVEPTEEGEEFATNFNDYEHGHHTFRAKIKAVEGSKAGLVIVTDANKAKPEEYEPDVMVCKAIFVAPTEKTVKPGDRVICESAAKYPITINDQEYWIIFREYVYSVIPSKITSK